MTFRMIRFEIRTIDRDESDSTNGERKTLMSTTRDVGEIGVMHDDGSGDFDNIPNGIGLVFSFDGRGLRLRFVGEERLIKHWEKMCGFSSGGFGDYVITGDKVRVSR